MGIFKTAMKAGIAKKVFDEARKPENQRRAKEFVNSLRNKSGKGRSSTRQR